MTQDKKAHIRKTMRLRRKSLTPQQQQSAAHKVCLHFARHPKIQAAQHIALFLSFDGEINTQPLIELLWQQQKSVYLPVIHPFNSGYLLFIHYTAHRVMQKNSFGIAEPKLDVRYVAPLSLLDIIVTPLVAFDKHKNRLGMGGGYYDRTLQYQERYHFYPIGLAHDCQYIDHVPKEAWDAPLAEIITPARVW